MSDSLNDSNYLQTLGAGLRVLDILCRDPLLSLADLGVRAQWNPSKAYRLLSTLESEGYVARTPEKTYYLGPAAIALGFSAHRQHPLVIQARDVLDWLAEETGESSYLVIRKGPSRVVLDMRDAPQRLRTYAPIGEEHPLHVSGAGLVILAFSTDDLIEQILANPLPVVTRTTETDPDRIRQLLHKIRQRGYHVGKEDFRVGAFSIGAPILNRTGQCVAAIAVAGPMTRLDAHKETLVVERVTEAASEVSSRLGYSGLGQI